jgi:hypothetical protein
MRSCEMKAAPVQAPLSIASEASFSAIPHPPGTISGVSDRLSRFLLLFKAVAGPGLT